MESGDDDRRGEAAAGVAPVTQAASAGSRSRPVRRRSQSTRAAPVVAVGVIALLAGLWGGLLRLGLPLPVGQTDLAALHGVLMPLGFLGTLIGVERAVALGEGWAWLVPAASGIGSLWLIAELPASTGQILITLAGFGLLAIFAELHRIQPSWHNAVQAAGAACWCMAGALWLSGRGLAVLVPWLVGFLVLTIAGERLELSRLVALSAWGRALFAVVIAVALAGLVISVSAHTAGIRVAGAGLLGLAGWLAVYDVVRRTIRMRGVTRYMAVALAAGYGWLAVTGGLWLTIGHTSGGAAYDAMLHAVFLGFVFSMVFAHAPVIVPAMLRVRLPFHPIAYVPLGLLHASLALRLIGGDVAGDTVAWQAGGVMSEVAILLFLGVTATSVVRGRRRPTMVTDTTKTAASNARSRGSAGEQQPEEQRGQGADPGQRAEHGQGDRAAGTGMQERGDPRDGDHRELDDQGGPVSTRVGGGYGQDVPHPGRHQYRERRPGDLVEPTRGRRGDPAAVSAQRGHQDGQCELAADPDRGGQHVHEQSDGVPRDREHVRIIPSLESDTPGHPVAPTKITECANTHPRFY